MRGLTGDCENCLSGVRAFPNVCYRRCLGGGGCVVDACWRYVTSRDCCAFVLPGHVERVCPNFACVCNPHGSTGPEIHAQGVSGDVGLFGFDHRIVDRCSVFWACLIDRKRGHMDGNGCDRAIRFDPFVAEHAHKL